MSSSHFWSKPMTAGSVLTPSKKTAAKSDRSRDDGAQLEIWWPTIEPRLLAAALAWTHSRDQAEDLVQDVAILVLAMKQVHLESADDLARWARTRLRWLAIDRFRHRQRRSSHEVDPLPVEAPETARPTPDVDLLFKRIEEAIAHLPERQKVVLSLSIEGESSGEIATRLRITEPTVRSLRRFARARLAHMIVDKEDLP